MGDKPKTVAVFIDAENIAAGMAGHIINQCEQFGSIFSRRIYGNFALACLKPWLDLAPTHALKPCFAVGGAGKNAADMTIAMDAVEMLYLGRADVFCLVTSDSDFTPVAMRIRERGKTVVGLGTSKASLQFRKACGKFIDMEKTPGKSAFGMQDKALAPKSANASKLWRILRTAMLSVNPDIKSWIDTSTLSAALRTADPSFKPQNYGSQQLKKLLLQFEYLETRSVSANRFEVRLRAEPTLKQA
ncbi:NYN domain-containing protein [Pararhizobium sp.]|uniref:NYN domain-containing protein n=1 Tax=Pararhizobium sp. TaxID=1977563 RepID=UPI002722DFD3|nr:NYN domain-containing protein [Pararhizobium sp.]MDO9418939.1 NYN domain-containing protein [Pararhizobium sp.]